MKNGFFKRPFFWAGISLIMGSCWSLGIAASQEEENHECPLMKQRVERVDSGKASSSARRHVRFNLDNNQEHVFAREGEKDRSSDDETFSPLHEHPAVPTSSGAVEKSAAIIVERTADQIAHERFESVKKQWEQREIEAKKLGGIKAPVPKQEEGFSERGEDASKDSSVSGGRTKISEKILDLQRRVGGSGSVESRVRLVQQLVGSIEGVNSINEGLRLFLKCLNAGIRKTSHVSYYHSEKGKEHLSIRIPTNVPLKINSLAELHELLMRTWQEEYQKGKSERERQRDLSLSHRHSVPVERQELERELPPHLKVRKKIEFLQRLFGEFSDYGTTLRAKVAVAQGLIGTIEAEEPLYEALTAFLGGINRQLKRVLSMGYFGGPHLTHLLIEIPIGKPTPEITTLAQFYDLLKISKMNYQGTDLARK